MKAIKWVSIFTALALVFTGLFGFGGADRSYAAGGPDDYKIEVNKSSHKLYLYNKYGKVIKTYPIATGRTKSLTPEGTFEIIIKINQPGWKGIPGGDPRNPLGPRWLGLQVGGDNGRMYGIHGTNQPSSIGKDASSGCVRMYSSDVKKLYDIVGTGTLVWITSNKHDGVWHGRHRTSKPSPAGKLTVSVSLANIRAAASLKSKVLQVVPRGTVLNKVGKVGDFYKIKLKSGKYAYVHYSVVR